jgi:hypothetical protein
MNNMNGMNMNNMNGMNMNNMNGMNMNFMNMNNINSFPYNMNMDNFNNNVIYEPSDIKNENDKITHEIKQIAYSHYLTNDSTKRAGEFLYSIGGIARKSLELSFRIFYELYQQFYEYNINNINKSKKDFYIWAKQMIDCNEIIINYSQKYFKEILKYSNSDKEFDNYKLSYFFTSFLKLYSKCKFCIPSVEVNFELENGDQFDSSKMDDIIFKGKQTKVNFCYLPQLKSNGANIDGGNFHVFTYIEGSTYKKEPIDY